MGEPREDPRLPLEPPAVHPLVPPAALVDLQRDPAPEGLLPVAYAELRRRAEDYLRRERADHTLDTTGIVHEAYLRLVPQATATWRDRASP